jgi:hypothetical protein
MVLPQLPSHDTGPLMGIKIFRTFRRFQKYQLVKNAPLKSYSKITGIQYNERPMKL